MNWLPESFQKLFADISHSKKEVVYNWLSKGFILKTIQK